jgi:hypothetical protein
MNNATLITLSALIFCSNTMNEDVVKFLLTDNQTNVGIDSTYTYRNPNTLQLDLQEVYLKVPQDNIRQGSNLMRVLIF